MGLSHRLDKHNRPNLNLIDKIPRKYLRLASAWTDEVFNTVTNWTRADAIRLFAACRFPARLRVGGGGPKGFWVNGQHAFLYGLSRFWSETNQMNRHARFWGYDYSVLSKIFTAFCHWYIDTHGRLLKDGILAISHKFEGWNNKLQQCIEAEGLVVPEEAKRIALLCDGTRWPTARPTRNNNFQRRVYNKKYGHNAGALITMGLDGIFYDCFCESLGRHNDRTFTLSSKINDKMRQSQADEEDEKEHYIIYFDKGGKSMSHFMCAYHAPPRVTNAQLLVNHTLKFERCLIEMGFAKLKASAPLLNNKRFMKMQLSPTIVHIKVSVLLCNSKTCISANQSAVHFNAVPLEIEDYYNLLEDFD